MKRILFRVTYVWMMVMMLTVMAGCSKAEQEQTNTEAAKEQDTDTSSAEKDSQEEEAIKEQDKSDTSPQKEATPTEAIKDSTSENKVPVFETVIEGGIREVYEHYGMKAGTCLSDIMISDGKYADLITENFNSITLENFMKPEHMLNRSASIAAGDIVVEFPKRTTDLLDWAKSNGLAARGHVLVWYSQTPDWIFYQDFDKQKGLVDRDTMLARMESYIKQTFEQLEALGYSEMFTGYDVVNEAIMENGTYRDCLWKQIIGDDYIWHAFHYADQYAPEHIKLYYNDYNEQFKTIHFVKLAKSLVDEEGNYLIDGIGCQGHLYTKDSIDQYMTTLKTFSSLGLDVQITELDVSLGTWQNIQQPTEENLKAQGKYYYELIGRIIKENEAGNTNVSAVTFWGFADHLSWRNNRNPVLFDKDLNPKYAYYGAKLDKVNAGY